MTFSIFLFVSLIKWILKCAIFFFACNYFVEWDLHNSSAYKNYRKILEANAGWGELRFLFLLKLNGINCFNEIVQLSSIIIDWYQENKFSLVFNSQFETSQ